MNNKRGYDVHCLFELLSAITSGGLIPKLRRKPYWDNVYKIADFHDVSNMLFYGTICMEEKSEEGWKKKFEERFHKAVRSDERYSVAIPELIALFEKNKIHHMLLDEFLMRDYYPQSDMKLVKNVTFVVEKNKLENLHALLTHLDYEKRIDENSKSVNYYKIPGISISLISEPDFKNQKLKKYYNRSVKEYKPVEGKLYLHEFSAEQNYVYKISALAQNFATAQIDIRAVLDIWRYYVKVYAQIDFDVINKELDFLGIGNFHVLLIKLAASWFGGIDFEEDDEILVAMEEYILTRGEKGREVCGGILPLIIELTEEYETVLEKRRKRQALEWVFPQIDYMEGMFVVLRKHAWLLPVCWVIRLVRIGARQTKVFLIEKTTPIVHKCKDVLRKIRNTVRVAVNRVITVAERIYSKIVDDYFKRIKGFFKKLHGAIFLGKNEK